LLIILLSEELHILFSILRITDIREIVRIIDRFGYSKQNSFGESALGRENSTVAKFRDLLGQNPTLSEEELAHTVMGSSYSPERYKSLKAYFVSKAVHQIALIDLAPSQHSEHTRAIFKGYKYLFFIRTLLTLGNRSAAMHFTKRLLHLSRKYELHFITVTLLDELCRDSVQRGKVKDYRKFHQLYNEQVELYLSEAQVRLLEEQALINFSSTLFVDESFTFEVLDSLNTIKLLVKKNETYFSKLSLFRLQYIYYQISGNPLKSAEACENAIKYMKGKLHLSPSSRFAEFAIYKLENFILLRDYRKGREAAEYCKQQIKPNLMLWFAYKQYEFLLMMQTLKFTEAEKIYEQVISHERYDSLSDASKKLWKLFGLHIKYVAQSKQTSDGQFKKSYLSRNRDFRTLFIHFPSYRKDKRGFNIAILTLNILVALEEGKLDDILKQEDALSSYRFKYLNAKHCHQSFVLFKLIRLVIKKEFDLEKVNEAASSIEKELTIAKLRPGEVFENIQILPPEWIWSRIKAILAERIGK